MNVEKKLSNAEFVHGLSFDSDITTEIEIINAHLVTYPNTPFNCLRFDTCSNTSVIREEQYLAY